VLGRLLDRLLLRRFRGRTRSDPAHPQARGTSLADGFDRAVDERGAEDQSFEDMGQIGSGTRTLGG
jgi:hypothetical protein